ncbi:MAG: T9SS type A sorting domain-containing protein [Rhizobacter sp.]|nr:T9SS type A sorting domain-containing protein [Ferruginibacter sp.]
MKKILVLLSILFSLVLKAQERHPFYIGHSLVNFDMPAMVQSLATSAGRTTYYAQQIINGAPLGYNYANYATAQGTSYRTAFPNGNLNTLIATEAIPLQAHITYSNAYEYADSIYRYAKNNNNNIPVRYFFYETWHCTNSGLPGGCAYDNTANSSSLWHPRLLLDFPLWTGILNYVRTQFPGDEIFMVPAGQALYNLTTQINAGNVNGISNVNQLFTDDIHLNNKGNYFVACLMYSCIYRQSPVGLTANLSNMYSVPFTDMPTAAQALAMQQVAWNTANALISWTGVSGVLPINLTSFTGECKSKNVDLKWTTSSEINNDYFLIQKSIDAANWENIGTVRSQGNSSNTRNYSFTEFKQNTQRYFYRLKQYDLQGEFTYSNILKVENCLRQQVTFSVSPNPAKETIKINFNGIVAKQSAQIYNSLGKKVKDISIDANSLIIVSDLPGGVYYIKLENQTQPFKFIKE